MEDYRVQLDFYDGPMDLLLYLVRKDEVDIGDIPIARITEQYCRYVEMIRAIDINLAGEFLLMAAWLIEIKTRMLLPTAPPDQAGAADSPTSAADALAAGADPRAELVRQLLAYKRFKDLADELGEAAAAQALKHPRAGIDWGQLVGEEVEPAVDIADVQIWDLFEAFGKLMEATGRNTDHQVTYDDTPIHEHAADLIDRLTNTGPLVFERLFDGRNRGEIVGLFLAMLELIRQKRIQVRQEESFGTILLSLRDPNEVAKTPSPNEGQGGPAVSDAERGERSPDQPEGSPAAPSDGAPPSDSDGLAATRSSPPGERRGARRRREDPDAGPIGVTWKQAARAATGQSPGAAGGEGDEVTEGPEGSEDQGLWAIDQALKSITIPPDPDMEGRAAEGPQGGSDSSAGGSAEGGAKGSAPSAPADGAPSAPADAPPSAEPPEAPSP